MSYSVIQIGHCGNKLGQSFFSAIAESTSKKRNSKNYEFLDKSDSRFFSYNEKEDKKCANAILLDTADSQVIRDITKPNKDSWCYGADCCKLFERLEPLNSWTCAYNVYGPLLREYILDAVRREVENYDHFCGFFLFGSLSGFTSSGIVSYVTELLRDEFPSVSLANVSVCPVLRSYGGAQFYNGVFNLSSLQNFSDAIFLLENEYLMKLCLQKLNMEYSCLVDYNLIASYQLANLLLPLDNYTTLNDMLSVLVPHPQFKIINLQSVPQEPLSSLPFCSYDWSTLLRSLRRMLLYSTCVDEVYGLNHTPPPTTSVPVTLTNLLILRGRDCASADINYFHKPQFPYASWVPRSSRMKIWTHPSPFLSCDRTALLANNGQLSIRYVEEITEAVSNLISRKRYFSGIEGNGLNEEDLKLSLFDVQQIVSSYKSLKA